MKQPTDSIGGTHCNAGPEQLPPLSPLSSLLVM